MTRDEAIALKLKKYRPDYTCKHGHMAFRYTKTNACSACANNANLRHLSKINKSNMGHKELTVLCYDEDVATIRALADYLLLVGLERHKAQYLMTGRVTDHGR